ncbi:hypothetical protein IWX65_000353 [Arthrobacter sp. CAN_A214]
MPLHPHAPATPQHDRHFGTGDRVIRGFLGYRAIQDRRS